MKKESISPGQPIRPHAQRNRDKLLDAARDAFKKSGAMASLDDIAKQAGVGAGTLYRHFPSRSDLLSAVYNDEILKLAEAGSKFTQTLTPVEALRAWMLLFVDCVAAEKIIAPALTALIGVSSAPCADTTSLVAVEIEALVARAVHSGDIRPDLDPMDLLRALVGVASVAAAPNWEQSAKRLVDILISGSRQVSPSP